MELQVVRPRREVVNKLWHALRTLDRHDAHPGKMSPLYWQLKDAVGLLPKDWRIALSGTLERAR